MRRLIVAAGLVAAVAVAFVAGLAVAEVQAPSADDNIVLNINFGVGVPLEKEALAKAEWEKLGAFLKEQNLGTVGPWTSGAERVNTMKAKGVTELDACGSTITISASDPLKLGTALVALDDALRSIKVQCGGRAVAGFKIYYHQTCRVAERPTKVLK